MNSRFRSFSCDEPWAAMRANLSAKVESFAEISGRTALLSMAQRAEMRAAAGGSSLSGSRSEPRIIAGHRGKPQGLDRGGPEQEGPIGMSPSISLNPGKEGACAKGKSMIKDSNGAGNIVIQILV